jgi:predicted DsbA family dithiol-disulfide isomerase
MSMEIDIFHDTVCPWCRIGKRHLELALAGWDGPPVSVRYRSFFLNEDIPPEGYDFRPYMRAKGGGRIPLEQFFAAPRERGAAVGLTFHFERIEKAPNSTLSHRLIVLTPAERRAEMVDAIYAAYFEQGRDIGDVEVLLEIAAAHELDVPALRAQLAGDGGLEQVMADVRWARQQGISGVPFFVIGGRYGLSGAQPPEMIQRVLGEVVG